MRFFFFWVSLSLSLSLFCSKNRNRGNSKKKKTLQVKALSASRRRGLARIIIAVDDGDPDAIAAEMTAMGLMPGFDGEGEDEGEGGGNGDGNGDGGEKLGGGGSGGEEEEPPQAAPVDPLLAAMLATVVFDTTPLPAAAVNPLDDSGKSLLKLAPVKAFPSVRGGGLFFSFLFLFFRLFSFFHFFPNYEPDTQKIHALSLFPHSSLSPSFLN